MDFVVVSDRATDTTVIHVESVSVVDGDAILTLSRSTEQSEQVSVSYLPGAMHPLQDTSYNEVPVLTDRSVRHVHPMVGNTTSEDDLLRNATSLANTPRNEAKVERLDLSASDLLNLDVLTGLTDLEALDLSDNQIEDVSILARIDGLEVLNLSNNTVTSVAALSESKYLRVLDLSRNAVANLSPLTNLTTLRRLDLSGNDLIDIRPLSTLQQL